MSLALPTGARALLKREITRYLRRYTNTFAPPLITNILYFSVFGVVLGGRIDQIQGFDYIVFLLPGLVVLGMISNAFENSSFSIFHGRWNEYIHETLTSPLSYSQMVAAYVVASALRGILVGVLIAIIGVAFTVVSGTVDTVGVAHPFYLAAFGLIVPTLFAGFGVIGGLLAEDFDHLTVMNQFILRPLVFFGAVFYSLETLPGIWRDLSLLNPMVYMVDGVRYGFLGYSDVDPRISLVVLSVLTGAVLLVDVALFERGYGLTD